MEWVYVCTLVCGGLLFLLTLYVSHWLNEQRTAAARHLLARCCAVLEHTRCMYWLDGPTLAEFCATQDVRACQSQVGVLRPPAWGTLNALRDLLAVEGLVLDESTGSVRYRTVNAWDAVVIGLLRVTLCEYQHKGDQLVQGGPAGGTIPAVFVGSTRSVAWPNAGCHVRLPIYPDLTLSYRYMHSA